MTPGANSSETQQLFQSLFSSILKDQAKIHSLKESDPDKKDLIEKTLAKYQDYRGRGFIFNYLSSGRGHGPFTELIDGSVKYDLIGGIGINILGHSHPVIVKANLEAALNDTLMVGNLMPYPQALELAQTIVDCVSEKSRLRHFWYAGSGSFANDMALKIIWQKKDPAHTVISCSKAFHGRSVATQELTDKPEYRQGQPESLNIEKVSHFDYLNPDKAAEKTLKELDALWEAKPNTFSCLLIELIQGEAGFVFGPRDYYVSIFEWAKSKGLYIWVDEVQSFTRTTELFAFQMLGLDEYVDIVTVGKALQCCGLLYTEDLNPKPGLIAGTFNGSLPSLTAGKKTLEYLTDGTFYGPEGKVKQIETSFTSRLKKLSEGSCQGKLGYVGGVGCMISFEVGDSSKETTNKVIHTLFKNGIICFIAGQNPSRIRFLLPLCLTDEHIDEIFSIIEKSILECF